MYKTGETAMIVLVRIYLSDHVSAAIVVLPEKNATSPITQAGPFEEMRS